jgi:hypothetical protein
MFKKIAVAALTLASFGAVIPATAAAAEFPAQNRVVVQKKVVVQRRGHVVTRRIVHRRAPARKVIIVKHA